jgi:uncharacterized membrane protein YdbT with pleckstrin-like domain
MLFQPVRDDQSFPITDRARFMTEQERHGRPATGGGLNSNQFSLLALMGITTSCAVAAAIAARAGAMAVIIIGISVPLILFGAYVVRDAILHRQPGWIVCTAIGVLMILHGIILTVGSVMAVAAN